MKFGQQQAGNNKIVKMSKNTLCAAVIQAASVAFDVDATLEKLDRLAREAAGKGARLAVFPEAFIGGYPKGADFGARVGSRTDAGRDDFLRYYKGAIEVPGPEVDHLSKLAKDLCLNMVVGVIERGGGTLYCTLLYFDEGGVFLGKHRKVMPTAMERLIWGFGDGTTLPVFDTPVGRVGGVICWENNMPLLRMHMYREGVELYCAPTVDDREIWTSSMRHIAWEGRCFVLSACQFATRADYPADYECVEGNDPETVLIRGGSCIVDPFGTVLAGPVYGEEAVLVADIDRDQIVRGKYDLDVAGHYARQDIFSLTVRGPDGTPV